MTTYQWLCLFGVPTIASGVVACIVGIIKQTKALKLGVQAVLRGQMISEWTKWSERGYAPIYAKENFENIWKQYHGLGANGVMDGIHKSFMELPDKLPETINKKG